MAGFSVRGGVAGDSLAPPEAAPLLPGNSAPSSKPLAISANGLVGDREFSVENELAVAGLPETVFAPGMLDDHLAAPDDPGHEFSSREPLPAGSPADVFWLTWKTS